VNAFHGKTAFLSKSTLSKQKIKVQIPRRISSPKTQIEKNHTYITRKITEANKYICKNAICFFYFSGTPYFLFLNRIVVLVLRFFFFSKGNHDCDDVVRRKGFAQETEKKNRLEKQKKN